MLMFLISSMFHSVTSSLRLLKWSSRDFYLHLNYDLLWGTTPLMTFVGWMACVRVDCLTKGSNKTQFKLSFGKLNQFIFDPAHWWWPKGTFIFAYSAKEGRKWITKQVALKKSIPHKRWNEIPPSTSPKWNNIWNKAKAQKRRHSCGWSSTRQWRLTSGMVKSLRRLTNVALIVAHIRWSRLNVGSIVVHSLNKGGSILPTSFGNSLPKGGISDHKIFFLWCNVSLTNILQDT